MRRVMQPRWGESDGRVRVEDADRVEVVDELAERRQMRPACAVGEMSDARPPVVDERRIELVDRRVPGEFDELSEQMPTLPRGRRAVAARNDERLDVSVHGFPSLTGGSTYRWGQGLVLGDGSRLLVVQVD